MPNPIHSQEILVRLISTQCSQQNGKPYVLQQVCLGDLRWGWPPSLDHATHDACLSAISGDWTFQWGTARLVLDGINPHSTACSPGSAAGDQPCQHNALLNSWVSFTCSLGEWDPRPEWGRASMGHPSLCWPQQPQHWEVPSNASVQWTTDMPKASGQPRNLSPGAAWPQARPPHPRASLMPP